MSEDYESWSEKNELQERLVTAAITVVGCAGVVGLMLLTGANEMLAGRLAMAIAVLLSMFTIATAGMQAIRIRLGRTFDEVTVTRPPTGVVRVEKGRPEPLAPSREDGTVVALLERAIQLRDETRAALAEWESDLAAVLWERRLLSVATEPATAKFNDAFDKMLDAVPDTPSLDVTPRRARQILDTAEAAWDAWVAASKHALWHGFGTMSDDERAALDQAKKLLAVAANPGATDEERHNAIRRVITTLSAVTHRPQAAVETEVFNIVDAHLLAIDAKPLQPAIESANNQPITGRVDQFLSRDSHAQHTVQRAKGTA